MSLLHCLKTATPETVQLFTLHGLETQGKVLSNHDGDTLDLVLISDNKLYRSKARMFGYDSPEIHPPLRNPDREHVIQRAQVARQRLWDFCTGDTGVQQNGAHDVLVTVHCGRPDKYGRLLVTLFANESDQKGDFTGSINQRMIDEGLGYPYYGGKKRNQ